MKVDPKLAHVAAQWKYSSPFISCRFDPTGKFVLAGAQDQSVARWELASGKQLAPLTGGHDSWVRAISFSPDGQTTYTGGYDGRLAWWSTASEKPSAARRIDAHSGWLRMIAVSADGKLIATAGNDNFVKLWNAADGQPVRTLAGHDRHVYSVMFHPSGQFLVSGDLRGQVHVWETATGKLARTFDAKDLYTPNAGQAAEYGGVRSLSLSPDGKHLACGGLYKGENPFGAVQEPLVLVFEWETGKKVQSHVANGGLKGIVWRAVHHTGGFLLGASGGSGGGVLLFWKQETPAEFHRFVLPNTALDMDLHPDGIQVLTAHHDRHVRITRLAAKQT